ncbi:MAG: hypothetical protein OEZ59_07950 [Deltaproteobacteria bacterium]|nr:hypothetical protein [Deltaproteobacteria bacterium]
MRPVLAIWFLLAALLLVPAGGALTQPAWAAGTKSGSAKKAPRKKPPLNKAVQKKKSQPQLASLLLPPEYDRKRRYPVLVAMPYTGGTAENFLEYYLFTVYNPKASLQKRWEQTLKKRYPDPGVRTARSYMILVPIGKGSTSDHSWRGFARAIERYEYRVINALNIYGKRYPMDRSRVVMAGHSLGGDLSWALSLRRTGAFSGAVISGSRTSYWEDDKLEILAAKGFRFFFSMGEKEKKVRLQGLSSTLGRLYESGMEEYRVFQAPGVGHEPPGKQDLFQAVDYALFGPSDDAAAASASPPEPAPAPSPSG